jgi:enoyl-CoA hydratase/carnithine racemase
MTDVTDVTDVADLTQTAGVEFEHVLVKTSPPVGRLTLNRPDRRNALSLAHMREVIAALATLRDDPEVQVVVLEGAGPAFSAGHDLGEMMDRDMAFYRELFDACTEMMEAIHRVPQPVIAKVHGVATAAGCQLVAACDLAVAADDARFATPGVKIGLFCSTPMVPISRAVGRKRALEMLFTGEFVDAATAVDWGLINRAVPAADLDSAVDELVGRITRFSPAVIGIGKEAFYTQIELDEHRAYDHTKAVMSTNAAAADAQEGMGAFLDKREPQWPGRG